jgi:hypothetical protein
MADETPAPRTIKHMPISEFRSDGYLQELNRLFLHPLGLALEVTVMDAETDDARLIEQIAPIIAGLLDDAKADADPEHAAREIARAIVADFWPRGSEHISGVWDYRDDPEGMVYGAGEIDVNKADRIGVLLAHKLAEREGLLGFGVQGPTDVPRDEQPPPVEQPAS